MCWDFVLTVLPLLCCVTCGDIVGDVDAVCFDFFFGSHAWIVEYLSACVAGWRDVVNVVPLVEVERM